MSCFLITFLLVSSYFQQISLIETSQYQSEIGNTPTKWIMIGWNYGKLHIFATRNNKTQKEICLSKTKKNRQIKQRNQNKRWNGIEHATCNEMAWIAQRPWKNCINE